MRKIFIFCNILGLVLFLGISNVLAAVASNCTDYCNSLTLSTPPLEPPSGQVCICNPLRAPDLESIIDSLISFIFIISVALAPLMIIVGAFYIMTAGGDPKKVGTGKNIILYALIGFAIILFAKGIIAVIEQLLGAR